MGVMLFSQQVFYLEFFFLLLLILRLLFFRFKSHPDVAYKSFKKMHVTFSAFLEK